MAVVSSSTSAPLQRPAEEKCNRVTRTGLAIAALGTTAFLAMTLYGIYSSMRSPYLPSRTVSLITAAGPAALLVGLGFIVIGLFCCKNQEESEPLLPQYRELRNRQ